MTITKTVCFLPLMAMSLLLGCTQGSDTAHHAAGDTIPMRHATNLVMVDYGDYVRADFRNPWDTTRLLQTYLLVPRDKPLPEALPTGTVVRVPLQSSVVYTTVHNSLIDELGAIDAVAGVCDAAYIRNQHVLELLADGTIADCGSSMSPNIERILQLQPDAILLSAYENSSDHNKVAATGVPVIDCTDYMEVSPLARAEWMRFYGRLFGKGEKADSMFNATETAYNEIRDRVGDVAYRPSVMTEMIYGGVWSVPGANSTTSTYITDAGGRNPFAEYKRAGSVQLSPEEVLYKAGDADVWILKYDSDKPMTLEQLGKENGMYRRFKAYTDGKVYGCNTRSSLFFDDAAFHPQWILAEYVYLLHPEILNDVPEHRYHVRVEK